MPYSQLQGWTPIAYHAKPEPTLVWTDLRHDRFSGLPFKQALALWRKEEQPPVVHTDLSALTALDDQPSLEPDLIIAHPSRCGSTLLARLAASADDTHLLLEPPLLFPLMQHNLVGGLDRPAAQILRETVRALSRVRGENKRKCVLKLNSQMTRFLPEIRKAFPKARMIWLQRRPAEIVESNLSNPSRRSPAIPADGITDWAVRRVTLAFMAAQAFVDDQVHVLDYRDLPDTAWTCLGDIMAFDPAATAGRMRDLMRTDSKTGKPYVPRSRQPLSDELQARIRRALDPIYHALALRRAA